MRRGCQICLSDDDRITLERWSRGRSIEARLVIGARVVLAAADGKEEKDVSFRQSCKKVMPPAPI